MTYTYDINIDIGYGIMITFYDNIQVGVTEMQALSIDDIKRQLADISDFKLAIGQLVRVLTTTYLELKSCNVTHSGL